MNAKPLLLIAALLVPPAFPQAATIAREGVEQVMAAIGRTTVREGSKEAAEQLAKIGGREAVEQLCASVTREGGEAALRELTQVAAKTGPDGILALRNMVHPTTILRQLDELPADVATRAAQRLAAGTEGRALGELAEQYGAAALRVEALNPGVGGILIRDLGQQGVELAGKLTTTQAQQLAAISREVASLAPAQQASVYRAISENASGFFKWAGQLVKDNPGKIIFGSAAVYELNTHWDAIVGTPNAPGFVPAAIQGTVGKPIAALSEGVSTMVSFLVPTILIAVGLWIVLALKHRHRLHKVSEEKARNKR